MRTYECQKCKKNIPLSWWENHYNKCSPADNTWVWVLFLLFAILAFASFANAEEVRDEKEWVWGCQIRGRSLSGECVMRKFTKVGEADNDVDTDEPQVLGFEPGNVPISKDGKPIFTRLLEWKFLRPGEAKIHAGTTCRCK